MNIINCRICGSPNKKLLFKKYGFDIVKCGNCNLVYSDFCPTRKFLKDYYTRNYFIGGNKKLGYDDYAKEEQSLRLTARKRIELLKLKSGGTVLDVGCAYGFFLSEMPESWNKYGLEISKFACTKAIDNNPDADIRNEIITPAIFANKKFDLITLWDVVEHLDNPKEVISIAYNKLKKGGKIVISTGDVDSLFSKIQRSNWHLYTPPQHLSFFSPTTIRKLLRSTGFRKVSVSHPSAYYPISYIVHKLSNLYNINLPTFKIMRNMVFPINLGDIVFVTAVK